MRASRRSLGSSVCILASHNHSLHQPNFVTLAEGEGTRSGLSFHSFHNGYVRIAEHLSWTRFGRCLNSKPSNPWTMNPSPPPSRNPPCQASVGTMSMGMKATACAALFWLWGLATLQPISGKRRPKTVHTWLWSVELELRVWGTKWQCTCYSLVLQAFLLKFSLGALSAWSRKLQW